MGKLRITKQERSRILLIAAIAAMMVLIPLVYFAIKNAAHASKADVERAISDGLVTPITEENTFEKSDFNEPAKGLASGVLREFSIVAFDTLHSGNGVRGNIAVKNVDGLNKLGQTKYPETNYIENSFKATPSIIPLTYSELGSKVVFGENVKVALKDGCNQYDCALYIDNIWQNYGNMLDGNNKEKVSSIFAQDYTAKYLDLTKAHQAAVALSNRLSQLKPQGAVLNTTGTALQITDREYAVINISSEGYEKLLSIDNAAPGQTILVNIDARGANQIHLDGFDLRSKKGGSTTYYYNAAQIENTNRDLGIDFILNIYDSTQPDNQWHPANGGTADTGKFYGYLLAPYGNINITNSSKGTLIANNITVKEHYKGVVNGTVVPASDFEEFNIALKYSQTGATADFIIENGDNEYTAANKTSGTGTAEDPYVWDITLEKNTGYNFVLTSGDIKYFSKKDAIPDNHTGAIANNESIEFSTDYTRNAHTVAVKYSETGAISNFSIKNNGVALKKSDASGSGTKKDPYVWQLIINEGGSYEITIDGDDIAHYNKSQNVSGETKLDGLMTDKTVSIENNYQIQTHQITFESGDHGKFADGKNRTITKDYNSIIAKSEIPTPIADKGYDFIGWDKNPEGATVTEAATYTAKYRRRKHTLTVKYSETGATSNSTIKYGDITLNKNDATGDGSKENPYTWTITANEGDNYAFAVENTSVLHYSLKATNSGNTTGEILADTEIIFSNEYTKNHHVIDLKYYQEGGVQDDFVIRNGGNAYTKGNISSGAGTKADPYIWRIDLEEGDSYDFKLNHTDLISYDKQDITPNNASGTLENDTIVEFNTTYTRRTHILTIKYVETGAKSDFVLRNGNTIIAKNAATGSGTENDPYIWRIAVNEGVAFNVAIENDNIAHYKKTQTIDGATAGIILADAELSIKNTYEKIQHKVTLKYYQEDAVQDNFVIANGDNAYTKSNKTSGAGTKADPYVWTTNIDEGDNYNFTLSGTDLSTYNKQDSASSNANGVLTKDETIEFSTKYTKRTHILTIKYVETGAKSDFVLKNNDAELKRSDAKGNGTNADPYIWTIKLDENASYDIKISSDDVEHYNKSQEITGNANGKIFADTELVIANNFTPKQYTVTFKPGDHGTFKDIKIVKTYGDALSAPAENELSAENHYDFIGWDKELIKTVSGDDSYVAQWKRRTHIVTIKYADPIGDDNFTITDGKNNYSADNKKSGTGTESDPYIWEVNYPEGENYNFALNIPEREGYKLNKNPNISTSGTVENDFTFSYAPQYKPKTYKLTIRKTFTGVKALADDYKITNDFDKTEFTVANAISGTGAIDDPYIWKLEVPYDTEVNFFEAESELENYTLTQKVGDKEDNKASITVKTTGNELNFASNYEKIAEPEPKPEQKETGEPEELPTLPITLDNIANYLGIGVIFAIIGAIASRKAIKYSKQI